MGLFVDIHKDLGVFRLDVSFEADSSPACWGPLGAARA